MKVRHQENSTRGRNSSLSHPFDGNADRSGSRGRYELTPVERDGQIFIRRLVIHQFLTKLFHQ
jgi:hypothetical protein